MSYILDALKQKSDIESVGQQPQVTLLNNPAQQQTKSWSFVLLLVLAVLSGVAISYSYNLLNSPDAPPAEAQFESQNQWPVFQTQISQVHFENPERVLAEDKIEQPQYGAIVNTQQTQTQPEAVVEEQPAQPEVEISDLLKSQFADAVEATEGMNESYATDNNEATEGDYSDQVRHLAEMPQALQDSIPRLVFSSHMYSSEPESRWVEVNDKKLVEGQWVSSNVRLISIKPQHVILQTGNYRYSLPALSEW